MQENAIAYLTGHEIAISLNDALALIGALQVDAAGVRPYAWQLLYDATANLRAQMNEAHANAESYYIPEALGA